MLETVAIVITTSLITNVVCWIFYTPKIQQHEIDFLRAEILKVECQVHELCNFTYNISKS